MKQKDEEGSLVSNEQESETTETRQDLLKLMIEEQHKKKRREWIASLVATLVGMLGSIISSSAIVGLKRLTPLQIALFVSIFLSIAALAFIISYALKAGEPTRTASKRIVDAYLTNIDRTAMNPVRT